MAANYQTHQFNDPTESLQKALGAGGMFAQTLKGMQEFDHDQQKMDIYRAEQARQAKLDAEHTAEKLAAADEKKILAGASAALANKSSNIAYGNDMFQAEIDAKKQNFLVNKSDAELGFKGKSYSDILKGVDTSKYDKDQLSEHEQFILADKDTNAKYTAGNKLALQTRLNKASGMNDADAHANAAKSLGLSTDMADGLIKSDSLSGEFSGRVESLKDDAMFAQTDAQALKGYQNSNTYKDYVAKYGENSQINDSISAANKAQTIAQKLRHDAISEKTALLGGLADGADKDKLSSEIEILKLQMQNSDSPANRAMLKLTNGSSKDPKASYMSDVNSVISKYSNQYNGAPENIRNNISTLALDMAKKQYSKEQIDSALSDSLGITRGKGKDADMYSFTRSALASQAPDTGAFNARYAGSDGESEMSIYVAQEKKKDELSVKLQQAIASGSGKAGEQKAAAIRKEIADLQRTPMASAHDAAYLAGKDFMRDFNVGEYGDQQVTADGAVSNALIQRSRKAITSNPIGHVPSAVELKSGLVSSEKGSKSKLHEFALSSDYNKMDGHQRASEIQYQAFKLIDSREGTKKDPYAVYNDSLNKSTTGTGILVAGLNKHLGHKYDPKNIKDRDGMIAYSGEMKNKAIQNAYAQAKDLNFSADAIPILASVNYQLGSGWKDEFKQSYALLKKGDYNGAISNLKKSAWNDQTKNRVDDFVQAIEQQKSFSESGRLKGIAGHGNDNITPNETSLALKQTIVNNIATQNKETNRTNKIYNESNMFLHPITTFQVGQENRDSRMKTNMLNNQLNVITTQNVLNSKIAELNRLKIVSNKSSKASDQVAIDNAERQVQLLKNQLGLYEIGSK